MSKLAGKVLLSSLILSVCSTGLLQAAENRQPTPEEFRELVKQYNQAGNPVTGRRSRPIPPQASNATEQYNRAVTLHTKKGASASELKEAAGLYQSAADAGIVQANTNLALLYLEGKGVKKDVKKALSLLNTASNKLDPQADLTLAKLYLIGKDVKLDEKKGDMYLSKAAKAGNQAAIKIQADLKEQKKKNERAMKEYQDILKKAQLNQINRPRPEMIPSSAVSRSTLKEMLNPKPAATPFPVIPGQAYFGTQQSVPAPHSLPVPVSSTGGNTAGASPSSTIEKTITLPTTKQSGQQERSQPSGKQ